MEQRQYRTNYTLPDSGEVWNSDTGTRADNTAPETVLFPEDPYYKLAMGNNDNKESSDD
jgi:hypothetical protein